jgi:hypothetical protein
VQTFPVETRDGGIQVVAHNATYPPPVLQGTSGPWFELIFGNGYHVLTQAEAEQLAMALISATGPGRVRRG